MNHYIFEDNSRSGRWRYFLAVFVFAVFLVVGGLLASNYKNIGNLVKVVSLVRTQYLYPVNSTQLVDGAIKGLVSSLSDPYSVYLDPKTFSHLQEQIRGSFGGLGILVGVKEQYLTVVRAYQGTPAAREGIKEGDVIARIDDRDAKGIDLDTAINLMRGPVGSKVNLTVNREGAPEQLQFTITREEISVPTVEGRLLEDTGIEHIVISQFTERTADEIKEVLEKAKTEKIKGIILDLRDNPGGELISAVDVAKNFIPKGPIVYIDYRVGHEQVFESEGTTIQLPLAVLINEGSASAAEILAGAVKDTGAGVLVGTKTFGKGIVQTVFRLDGGAGLKLTTARYLTPAKNDIHEKGVEPDILVQSQEDRLPDVQLDKAVEIIKEKIAIAG
ncbi:S41 family peptidase [Pelotomaculum terephthalicicum JT]|uniref:S41 family peptidase n=1 Tax=Pelotomaculum TaxID=191373 RepID=UPI0009CB7DEA|nr:MULTISPECIES: S41 family peptidase [Pelotomaculum]MCG9969287.1 S41 family peptidase [Pelotomaculum terephthalicicum JT]OPX88119.1 MAG: Carboxy-terminal processing protease CtpB precursor [Pelotomaculum sp. PtaB.Bin117]OPY58498.1 MAG: Carboxy-terminal processing protease CtpB precursor [Pelotomaculum sp. PtaU1.Bin065]